MEDDVEDDIEAEAEDGVEDGVENEAEDGVEGGLNTMRKSKLRTISRWRARSL